MNRLLPYPLLWLGLLLMWLLLSGFNLGQLLLGIVVATFACWMVSLIGPPKPRIKRVVATALLVVDVVADVIMSNVAVIGLLVTGRTPRSVFLVIPLELKEPNGLAILACIVTATPGSAWIHYDSRHSTVTIHVLDTHDEDAWIATLKRNYEHRLMEIFQ